MAGLDEKIRRLKFGHDGRDDDGGVYVSSRQCIRSLVVADVTTFKFLFDARHLALPLGECDAVGDTLGVCLVKSKTGQFRHHNTHLLYNTLDSVGFKTPEAPCKIPDSWHKHGLDFA